MYYAVSKLDADKFANLDFVMNFGITSEYKVKCAKTPPTIKGSFSQPSSPMEALTLRLKTASLQRRQHSCSSSFTTTSTGPTRSCTRHSSLTIKIRSTKTCLLISREVPAWRSTQVSRKGKLKWSRRRNPRALFSKSRTSSQMPTSCELACRSRNQSM